jgi:hypothetical protein
MGCRRVEEHPYGVRHRLLFVGYRVIFTAAASRFISNKGFKINISSWMVLN